MQEWMNTPVSQLKRLVKSRAGRIAELQMEIKILGGIIEKKVSEGDLGGSGESRPSTKPEAAARPKESSQVNPIRDEPAQESPAPVADESAESEQTKITKKSSEHAFQEID